MLVVSLLFAFVLGGLIEVVQYLIGRYMEWQDLFTDMLGALFGYLAVLFSLPVDRRPVARPVILLLSITVLLIAFYPVFYIVNDNLIVEADFPVIADFESEASLARWDNNHVGRFELDPQLYIEGQSSVYIEFEKGEYPDVSLLAIYPNWSHYQFLNLSIHNDQNENLEIELKIYDQVHRQTGYDYHDRFNHEINLRPGWNKLKIKLLDIFNSPQARSMDLENIVGFSLFLYDPKESKSIHIDNIYLSN